MKAPLPSVALGARAHADHPGRGIVFALAGVFVFSSQDAIAKWLAAGYPVMEIVFFRALFALAPTAVFVIASGGFAALRTRRIHLHLLRSGLLFLSLICYYLAIRTMPLADAVTIMFSAPLFMTALSVPILRERVGPRRWAAVIVGFTGVLVASRPGSEVFDTSSLLVLVASLLYAGAMIVTRRLTRTETNAAVLAYHYIFSIAVAGLFLPGQWVTPAPVDAALLAGMGLMGAIGAFASVQAYRCAPVSVIAPFDYTSLLWATTYGYLVFADLPGPAVLAGAVIIIASNLYIVHRERTRRTAVTPYPSKAGES